MEIQEFNDDRIPLTVAALIAILQTLPQDATARAYEGELTGIIIEKRERDGDRYPSEIARIHAIE